MNTATIMSKLADQGILGILLALSILAIVFLYKRGEELRDKEMKEKDDLIEKVTLVLRAIDNTEKSILINLEANEKK